MSKERYLIETEIKVSMSDFRKDQHKPRHRHFKSNDGEYPTTYFYFAVPKEIANQVSFVCGQLYPYAGVLGCPEDTDELAVDVYRSPKALNGKRLSMKQVIYLVRAQTATLCRLARKVDEQARVIHRGVDNG